MQGRARIDRRTAVRRNTVEWGQTTKSSVFGCWANGAKFHSCARPEQNSVSAFVVTDDRSATMTADGTAKSSSSTLCASRIFSMFTALARLRNVAVIFESSNCQRVSSSCISRFFYLIAVVVFVVKETSFVNVILYYLISSVVRLLPVPFMCLAAHCKTSTECPAIARMTGEMWRMEARCANLPQYAVIHTSTLTGWRSSGAIVRPVDWRPSAVSVIPIPTSEVETDESHQAPIRASTWRHEASSRWGQQNEKQTKLRSGVRSQEVVHTRCLNTECYEGPLGDYEIGSRRFRQRARAAQSRSSSALEDTVSLAIYIDMYRELRTNTHRHTHRFFI